MDPLRQKLYLLLVETAHEGIKTIDPQSECAKQLSAIADVDTVIAEEIRRLCMAATLLEVTKIFLLAAQLKKTHGQKADAVKSSLKKIAEVLIARVERQSGPLKLPQSCRGLLLSI